jgi:multimeric flavodoxin WrbA
MIGGDEMKIVVLNGSPKGDLSVTMQYIHYMKRKFPQHEWVIHNISQRINAIEKKEERFRTIIDEIRSAEGVFWVFPVYFLLVPYNYKRFIELIWERGAEDAFKGIYAASLSTSIHYFDHIAHKYIHGICDDLNMKYVDGFSADMYDLLDEKERKRLLLFAKHFFGAIDSQLPRPRNFRPVVQDSFEYVPGAIPKKIDIDHQKLVVLTDEKSEKTNLGRMIQQFTSIVSDEAELINLHEIDIHGGCLGCIQCGYDNSCAYGHTDGFVDFFDKKIKTADILVLAGSVKDRYLSSRWKLFFDRSFYNNHVPVMAGKQLGFIISGPLSQIPHLTQALEGFYECQQANIVDFVTDECGDSTEIDIQLQAFSERLVQFSKDGYVKPISFLGVGGRKIFRDDIFGRLRFPFRADHNFFKRNGMYDYPQKDRKLRIRNAIMLFLSRMPSFRKEVYSRRVKSEMVKPLQKIVERE